MLTVYASSYPGYLEVDQVFYLGMSSQEPSGHEQTAVQKPGSDGKEGSARPHQELIWKIPRRGWMLGRIAMACEDCSAHYKLAKQYELQGKLDSAVIEYKEVLRIDPNHASAHYSLGRVYRLQGNFELADREFAAVRRINPKFAADDTLDIIGQKVETSHNESTRTNMKRIIPMPLRIVISLLAAFIIGGPIAAITGTQNPTVGIIVAIVAFALLSLIYGGGQERER